MHLYAKIFASRQREYRDLFRTAISEIDIHRVEQAATCHRPIGNNPFCEYIESRYNIYVPKHTRGCPKLEKGELVKNKRCVPFLRMAGAGWMLYYRGLILSKII